jgi:hypothetical protein
VNSIWSNPGPRGHAPSAGGDQAILPAKTLLFLNRCAWHDVATGRIAVTDKGGFMRASDFMRKVAVAVVGLMTCGLVVAHAPPAQAQSYIKAGVLTCAVSPGIGLIITSSKSLSCTFTPDFRGPEYYGGTIRKVGIDIGITGATVIVWAVLSSVQGFPVGALAGTYGGVSAEATVGVGLGANVLLGGSNRNFALQPLSVQGQVGLDFAVGITQLELFAQ